MAINPSKLKLTCPSEACMVESGLDARNFRKMDYVGSEPFHLFTAVYIFKCGHCGHEKRIRERFFSGGYDETESGDAPQPGMADKRLARVIYGAICVFGVFSIVFSIVVCGSLFSLLWGKTKVNSEPRLSFGATKMEDPILPESVRNECARKIKDAASNRDFNKVLEEVNNYNQKVEDRTEKIYAAIPEEGEKIKEAINLLAASIAQTRVPGEKEATGARENYKKALLPGKGTLSGKSPAELKDIYFALQKLKAGIKFDAYFKDKYGMNVEDIMSAQTSPFSTTSGYQGLKYAFMKHYRLLPHNVRQGIYGYDPEYANRLIEKWRAESTWNLWHENTTEQVLQLIEDTRKAGRIDDLEAAIKEQTGKEIIEIFAEEMAEYSHANTARSYLRRAILARYGDELGGKICHAHKLLAWGTKDKPLHDFIVGFNVDDPSADVEGQRKKLLELNTLIEVFNKTFGSELFDAMSFEGWVERDCQTDTTQKPYKTECLAHIKLAHAARRAEGFDERVFGKKIAELEKEIDEVIEKLEENKEAIAGKRDEIVAIERELTAIAANNYESLRLDDEGVEAIKKEAMDLGHANQKGKYKTITDGVIEEYESNINKLISRLDEKKDKAREYVDGALRAEDEIALAELEVEIKETDKFQDGLKKRFGQAEQAFAQEGRLDSMKEALEEWRDKLQEGDIQDLVTGIREQQKQEAAAARLEGLKKEVSGKYPVYEQIKDWVPARVAALAGAVWEQGDPQKINTEPLSDNTLEDHEVLAFGLWQSITKKKDVNLPWNGGKIENEQITKWLQMRGLVKEYSGQLNDLFSGSEHGSIGDDKEWYKKQFLSPVAGGTVERIRGNLGRYRAALEWELGQSGGRGTLVQKLLRKH